MTEAEPNLETILRQCAAEAPNPWYPSAYVQATGVPRDRLDPFLDRLRLGGFVQLTEWVQGRGQGYALTPAGVQLLEHPRLLARLRTGELPPRREEVRRPAGAGTFSSWERGEAARAALLTYTPPLITVALIAANIAVFLAGMALAARQNVMNEYLAGTGDPQRKSGAILEQIGAISAADVALRHQWWRLLSCCFVHIGLLHLGVNMYSLYVIGPLLERMWGRWYFLLLYVVSGFGGSCAMVADTPLAQGAGASGALFGVFASMMAWIYLNRKVLPPSLISDFRRQFVVVIVLNLAITFGISNISKGAHFGGAAVGLLAAVPVDYLRFGRRHERVLAVIGLVAIPVACIGLMDRSFKSYAGQIDAFQADREVPEFNRLVMPGVNQVTNRAKRLDLGEVEPLLSRRPARRDPDAVEHAVKALGEVVDELTAEEARLSKGPAFASRRIAAVHQETVGYLREWTKLLELSRTALEKWENWTPEDQKGLDEQRQALAQAYNRWLESLQGRAARNE